MPPFINNPLPSSMRSKYCLTSSLSRTPLGNIQLAEEVAMGGTGGACGSSGAFYCSANDMSLWSDFSSAVCCPLFAPEDTPLYPLTKCDRKTAHPCYGGSHLTIMRL